MITGLHSLPFIGSRLSPLVNALTKKKMLPYQYRIHSLHAWRMHKKQAGYKREVKRSDVLFKCFTSIFTSWNAHESCRVASWTLDRTALFLQHLEFKFPGFGCHNKGTVKHLEEIKRIITYKQEKFQKKRKPEAPISRCLGRGLGSWGASLRRGQSSSCRPLNSWPDGWGDSFATECHFGSCPCDMRSSQSGLHSLQESKRWSPGWISHEKVSCPALDFPRHCPTLTSCSPWRPHAAWRAQWVLPREGRTTRIVRVLQALERGTESGQVPPGKACSWGAGRRHRPCRRSGGPSFWPGWDHPVPLLA